LIDPPPTLAGINKCVLVGKSPALQSGTNIMVVHHQRDQFIFRSLAENDPPAAKPVGQNIGGADTQPGLAVNIARIIEAPTLSGLSGSSQQAGSPLAEKGLFVRFHPGETGKILCNGELLLLPDHYVLPKEKPQHEEKLAFMRLNHTVNYQNGHGIQLCCSAGYFRMMEKILKLLRSETIFSADMKRAAPAPDYALRNPGFKRLDPTQVSVMQVFPEEIIAEYGIHLPAVFAQFKKDATPGTLHFKLLLETENPTAEKTRIFNPYSGSVVDLIHDLMSYDFRAIVVKKE
jgi:hypothetical protein